MQPSFSKTQHTGDNVLSWLCSWALQPDQPDLVLGSATCQMDISLYHSQQFIKPQFPHLLSRNNNCIYFRGSYWTLNRLMQRKLTCWQRVTEQRTANLFWNGGAPDDNQKDNGTSVLQPQGTEFSPQPCKLGRGPWTLGRSPLDTLTEALWDPEKAQLSHAWTTGSWKLLDTDCVVLSC